MKLHNTKHRRPHKRPKSKIKLPTQEWESDLELDSKEQH